MSFRWTGPMCISVTIGYALYEVKGQLDWNKDTAHEERLKPYRSGTDGDEVSTQILEQVRHIKARCERIEMLMDIKEAPYGLYILVQWLGLTDKCEWTCNALL